MINGEDKTNSTLLYTHTHMPLTRKNSPGPTKVVGMTFASAYTPQWNSFTENRMFHSICAQVKLQTVLDTDGWWWDRDELLQGSRGCEQATPPSTIVSVQQDVALDDLSAITLPHVSLCGGGGPRYPPLLQGKFSSEGMGLLRYVRYRSPKQQKLSLHVAVGSPRRRFSCQ